MPKTFTPEYQTAADALLKRYPAEQPNAALLPMLHLAEKEFGLVDDEIEAMIADLCSVSQVKVHNVWSFYHMYARQPRGKYHIRICHNISCSLLGTEHLIDHLQKKLGLDGPGTASDGMFSLERVECLGACGTAPVMLVNEDLQENLTVDKIDQLLEELRKK